MATAEPEKLRNDVLRQIEYYFSDLALPYDDFLKAAYDENDKAILVATLAESPRIVKMLPERAAEERASLIVELVEAESDSLRVVDGIKLARIYPLPDDDEAAPRSVYLGGCAKWVGVEALKTALAGSSAASTFMPIVSIRRLRDVQRDRAYSGQLFIECESVEKAVALQVSAGRGSCGIACAKSKVLSEFYARQHASVLEQRLKLATKKRPRDEGGEGAGSSGSAVVEESAEAKAAREAAEASAREAKAAEDRLLVLRFEGAGEGAGREEVAAVLPADSAVAYIDFSRGDTSGHVRFESAAGCQAALDALTADGANVQVGSATPSWRLLAVDESAQYWSAYRERAAANKRQRGGAKAGKGGGKGRGKGKGGWRGRGGGRR